MRINLVIFVTSTKAQESTTRSEMVLKTFESTVRPFKGDIMDDPGFDPKFHNGYEVVKVTMNYAENECYVSLAPLAMEIEEISIEAYLDKLVTNGWRIVSKEELVTN